jgi:hypothetical protein
MKEKEGMKKFLSTRLYMCTTRRRLLLENIVEVYNIRYNIQCTVYSLLQYIVLKTYTCLDNERADQHEMKLVSRVGLPQLYVQRFHHPPDPVSCFCHMYFSS